MKVQDALAECVTHDSHGFRVADAPRADGWYYAALGPDGKLILFRGVEKEELSGDSGDDWQPRWSDEKDAKRAAGSRLPFIHEPSREELCGCGHVHKQHGVGPWGYCDAEGCSCSVFISLYERDSMTGRVAREPVLT